MTVQQTSSREARPASLFQAGRNCWRIEHADRAAVLVDGEAYFRAVRRAIAAAQRSILIIGWDIDSRLKLIPEGANDGLPEALGDFLHKVVARRKGLHAYVLSWDYTVLFALDREWMSSYKLGWRTHHRLHFRMDGQVPLGGSHHQKVVVIDDKIAFVGGLDLTHDRWDTPAHACGDPLRHSGEGKCYAPFHDVQIMFDGPAALAAGDLARERWYRAAGFYPRRPLEALTPDDPWPQGHVPDFTDVEIAIARTEPELDERPGVQEIRALYGDAIAAARRNIYLENQYFTSGLVAQSLLQRLQEPEGPDVVVVSRQAESGWLEEMTMGVQRARLHARLKAEDRHGRYRMLCPFIPGLSPECVNVHSKVMIIDDEFLSIGSANLNNRSMVLDTECNVAIEARGDPRIRAAIAAIRDRLLGEHLDVAPQQVNETLQREQRLIPAIMALRHEGRSLAELDPVASPEAEALVPALTLLDPEKIVPPEELVAQLVPTETHGPMRGRFITFGVVAVLLCVLAAVWRFTPLSEYMNPQALSQVAQVVQDMPFTPVLVLLVYLLAALLVIPHSVQVAATGLVFGPWAGLAYAVAGTAFTSAVTYGIGHWMGRDTVRRLAGGKLSRLSRTLAKRGVISVALLRQIPLGPYALVNIVCGASHISFRDFMLGTLLGMTPGSVVMLLFLHHFTEAIRNPSMGAFIALAAIAAVLVGVAYAATRILRRRAAERFSTGEA
ncbi:VTT domain-containing protein [Chitiniphilus purpureus]|uniref:VTT domain-containing protein n=1 Tax=Chitiniphilus purpureus TaxID=2981137 RepID=A0ABY6DHY5_9NEIS|nr:VTT domain-containing protein [Chitiniphilus sp. CD1]UXY13960.1 VTT domain-containing protein [Chitiniphilus sp. CD1]